MKLLDASARQELRTPRGLFCLTLILLSVVLSTVAVLATLGLVGQNFAGFRIEPTLTVSAVNESDWNGPKAGVVTYDRILEVDGKIYTTPQEFKALIARTAPGTPLTYTLESKETGKKRNVVIPVQTFTGLDFVRSFLLLYLVGFLHIFVGAAAYLIRPANPAARAHLFMTLAIGVTTTLVGDYDTTMLFPRFWIAAVALTGGACLHLGLYFPQKKPILERLPWLVWIPYVISFGLLGAWEYAFRPLGLAGYQAAGSGMAALFDLHFALYDGSLLWSLFVGFLGLIGLIVHSLLKAKNLASRNQAKVALLGAVVAYLPMTIFWLIMDQILHIHLPAAVATICWILFVVFPLAIAYAIIQHKMFDIDFVLKQSMTYSALVVLLGSLYVLLAAGLQQMLTPLMASNSELTSYMLTTAVTILLFEPLKLNIRGFIDTKFFRTKYDFRAALSEFIDAARSTIDVDELIPKLVEVVEKTIHPKHILLLLKNPETNTLKQAYSHGIDLKLKDEIALDDPALLAALGLVRPRKNLTSRLTGALNLGQMAQEGPLPSPLPYLLVKRITAELPSLEQTEALSNSLTLPLTVKTSDGQGGYRDELIGLLTFGEKRSEMEYTIEDRQLYQSIGQQLALTLHSSQLAVEVAEKEAIKQTLQKARVIQQSMLPAEEMELEQFAVTGFSESADETGGDYYDWYKLEDGRFIVAMGDVTGHGIDAAMIVSMAKSCLYNQIEINPDVTAVMAALNRTINDVSKRTDRRNRKLMSFVYSLFDPETQTCRLGSAGHWFPYHYKAKAGELTNYPEFKGAFPLGQWPASKFKLTEQVVQMEPGDVLVYFTDGLHEASNGSGQAFELERVEQLIHWYHDRSAHEIRDLICRDWEQFIGSHGLEDDMTLVVVKMAPQLARLEMASR